MAISPEPKWITSMESFVPLIMPILQKIQPKMIGEIGAAEGGNTRVLYNFLQQNGGKLHTIDPFPRGTFLQWVQQVAPTVTHFAEFSLKCIPDTGRIETWFVDGDHNWYTVFNELKLIDDLAQKNNLPALIFMHDVGWPCGRRDMYYNPSAIPAEFVQPCSNQIGLSFAKSASPVGALKGPYWALQEGGPRNGVLTAVEDFMQQAQASYQWFYIPAILGLGVLVDSRHPYQRDIAEFYRPYHNNSFIEMLERDRISHYLTAMQLQVQTA